MGEGQGTTCESETHGHGRLGERGDGGTQEPPQGMVQRSGDGRGAELEGRSAIATWWSPLMRHSSHVLTCSPMLSPITSQKSAGVVCGGSPASASVLALATKRVASNMGAEPALRCACTIVSPMPELRLYAKKGTRRTSALAPPAPPGLTWPWSPIIMKMVSSSPNSSISSETLSPLRAMARLYELACRVRQVQVPRGATGRRAFARAARLPLRVLLVDRLELGPLGGGDRRRVAHVLAVPRVALAVCGGLPQIEQQQVSLGRSRTAYRRRLWHRDRPPGIRSRRACESVSVRWSRKKWYGRAASPSARCATDARALSCGLVSLPAG